MQKFNFKDVIMILQQTFQQESFSELTDSSAALHFDNVTDELSADVLELMAQLQQILPKKTDSKLDIIECAIEYIAELNAMLVDNNNILNNNNNNKNSKNDKKAA